MPDTLSARLRAAADDCAAGEFPGEPLEPLLRATADRLDTLEKSLAASERFRMGDAWSALQRENEQRARAEQAETALRAARAAMVEALKTSRDEGSGRCRVCGAGPGERHSEQWWCGVLGTTMAALQPSISGTTDVYRLVTQARAISRLLSEAGIGPCTIPEGVRLLLNRAEEAESALAAVRAEGEAERNALKAQLDAISEDGTAELNEAYAIREQHRKLTIAFNRLREELWAEKALRGGEKQQAAAAFAAVRAEERERVSIVQDGLMWQCVHGHYYRTRHGESEPVPCPVCASIERLTSQAITISHLLAEAGIGPCTLAEGVRQLWVQREDAKEQRAAVRAEGEREGQGTKRLYYELLFAVSKKYPNESRHDTALRYIHEAESHSGEASAAIEALAEKGTP